MKEYMRGAVELKNEDEDAQGEQRAKQKLRSIGFNQVNAEAAVFEEQKACGVVAIAMNGDGNFGAA